MRIVSKVHGQSIAVYIDFTLHSVWVYNFLNDGHFRL